MRDNMAFVKRGDPLPVTSYVDFDNDSPKVVLCPKCEQPMTVIVINEEENKNKLTCKCNADLEL